MQVSMTVTDKSYCLTHKKTSAAVKKLASHNFHGYYICIFTQLHRAVEHSNVLSSDVHLESFIGHQNLRCFTHKGLVCLEDPMTQLTMPKMIMRMFTIAATLDQHPVQFQTRDDCNPYVVQILLSQPHILPTEKWYCASVIHFPKPYDIKI